MADLESIARKYLLLGIQQWGQTAERREEATRDFVNAANFVFGSREGDAWLEGVLKALRYGRFETEVEQLLSALNERQPKAGAA